MGSRIITGDAFEELAKIPSNSVQMCCCSPPYWGLRDYGHAGQLGMERTPDEYVANMRLIFEQVKRVLRPDGTLWLNLGDSYSNATVGKRSGGTLNQWKDGGRRNPDVNEPTTLRAAGLPAKNLVGIPWRVAFALQADGWYLRQDIIWHKPNPMPESVRDRCTKAHEYIFLLAKSEKYLFNIDAIKEPANYPNGPRNTKFGKYADAEMFRRHGNLDKIGPRSTRQKRSVWRVTTKSFKGAHFATFPENLIEPCVLAGSNPGDTILDPFFGAGTTGVVAKKHGRKYIGIEINPEYAAMASKRIEEVVA